MSRSIKKRIYKDKGDKKESHRVIRNRINQEVREVKKLVDIDEYEISNPKVIVNDYDICDYIIGRFLLNSNYNNDEIPLFFKKLNRK